MKINKSVLSWAFYDWANSSFSTTIMAGFFPIFFKSFWSNGADATVTTARLGYVISLSSLLIAILSPTLGAISDAKGYRKKFCLGFMFLGALSCISMGWISEGQWQLAAVAYAMGMVCFTASCIFYDALLPVVAEGKDMDMASSLGYGLGYLGGGVLFALNVVMYLNYSAFGFSSAVQAVQISFVSVGIWWMLFSLPLALGVPEKTSNELSPSLGAILKMTAQSLQRLWITLQKIKSQKNLFLFLVAFWLYIDGVYTVMTMAVDFGISLGLASQDLIAALLLTQFIGFPCAVGFGFLSKKWGIKKPILIALSVYMLIVLGATQMTQAWHFYVLAGVVGVVQGGVQSLSRSLFARMVPVDEAGEYFGFFNLIGKFASIIGPLVVAVTVSMTGNPRWGLSGLIVLFLLGGFLLLKVDEKT